MPIGEHLRAPLRGRVALWWVRAGAWVALAGATGLLVRAEAQRPTLPGGVTASTDLVYKQFHGRPLRLNVYEPVGPSPAGGRPAVLAIHGGGWRGGSKDGYGRIAARLAQHGFVVVAADYTLSRPGAPSWPENLDDVRDAVRWMRRHAPEYGIDPSRIAALGASAGGHLALLLGMGPDRSPGPESARVGAVIDFYGPTDLRALVTQSPRARASVGLLVGRTTDPSPERLDVASPLRHVARDNPPILILHGNDDALIPLAQSRSLAQALQAAGVPHRLMVVEGGRHGFEFRIDERRDLLPDLLAFLNESWKD